MQTDESETRAAGEAGRAITERIAEEGIVLLKNERNVLPLASEQRINVFGWSAIDPVYGGNGSGSADESGNVTLLQGLESAGFTVNQELIDFYRSLGYSRLVKNAWGQFTTGFEKLEAPVESYSTELLAHARAFSDVAVIVISRIGSEGADMPMDMSAYGGEADEHYLELGARERAMVDMVRGMGFAKVCVLVNSSHAMELGFLEWDGIDAALWIGGPGSTGMKAVGSVLRGTVTPSGRLTDTYAYDVTSAPSYCNFGEFTYTNSEHEVFNPFFGGREKKFEYYVDYAEGIYVGYRYYETRWIDNATGACDEAAYRAAVQYPFGYGLSYTSFAQQVTGFAVRDGTVVMDVLVTNTGTVSGKDVVQVYYTAPYTAGGIEKSHVVLAGFAKTALLAPGQSATVTVSFAVEDMASYDYAGEGCYVLDAGVYRIALMADAHTVLEEREYEVPARVVYGADNARSSDHLAAINRFDSLAEEGVQYVSRADWEGTLPTTRITSRMARTAVLEAISDYSVPQQDAPALVVKNNGLALADLAGLDYDDPKWERLLEQLSPEDMQNLIGFGGWQTKAVDSVKKPQAVDIDGPAGLNALINSTAYKGIQYASGVLLASTWNVELARQMGDALGAEAAAWKVSGLYAPGVNIHRSPFNGRNFEYYSEDPLLSGLIVAQEVAGIQSNGVYCYVKHLALNDQETQRYGLCVWANEQAMREIYFRPFELAVKQGGARGMMSAFARLGSTWCGANAALCTTVLRQEWGFRGTVITDFCGNEYMQPNQAIRAGNDLMLSSTGFVPTDTSNASLQAMRTACHNILYTTLQSNAMAFNNRGPRAYWVIGLVAADVLIAALAIWCCTALYRRRSR